MDDDEPRSACHCEGGCERDAYPGEALCCSCQKDGCKPHCKTASGAAESAEIQVRL